MNYTKGVSDIMFKGLKTFNKPYEIRCILFGKKATDAEFQKLGINKNASFKVWFKKKGGK